MSFGFAIGDFIAVAELAHKLWHDVYMVARTAPEEVRSLSAELSVLSQSIRLLIEHANNPDSILLQAGQDRVQLVNTMIVGANETLLRLENFAKKHQIVSSEAPSKFRRGFNKLRYVNDASTINSLRSKVLHLVYHNGVLNLLLTSIGNSSLERMETENQKIAADVIEIKQQISSMFRLPVAPSHVDKETQLEVSRVFLEKAEIERPWHSFGIDVWIQAGKWWLNKALFILRRGTSVDNEIDPQAYVDLLKASWILTDILQDHPQRTFLHKGSQPLDLMALSNTIKNELERFSRPISRRPTLEKVRDCDMSIWVITPVGALNLGEERGNPGLGFHMLCERYGVYFSQDDAMRSECVFKLWMRKAEDEKAVYLTARTASDIAILSHRLLEKFKFIYPRGLQRSSLNGKAFVCLTLDLAYADHRIRQNTLWFNSVEDAMMFQALIDGALHYLKWFRNGSLSPASLHSISMLKLIARLNIHQLGSGANAVYFESPAEERLYIELLIQERNNICFGEENQLWATTMKILQQYLDHGPQGHWSTMRRIRNKAGITHQWYTVQIMQVEGPKLALKLLGNEGADLSTIILEFLFAAGVQKNFQWLNEILRVASAENTQLHLDDIVKSFSRADLVVACKVHMRAFWDPELRILLTDYANFLGPGLRNQYANISLIEGCMAMYTFWCPGISNKIPESQCSLCSRYPYHPAAEFQEGDGIPTIVPEIS